MPVHYLGWERPALHLAVDYLWTHYATDYDFDLSHLIVVLPSSLAGRRLKELLARRAQSAEPPSWLRPPQVVTPGQLPRLILDSPQPLASPLETRLAWIAALQSIPAAELKQLLGRVPAPDDLAGWFRLAAEMQQLDNELSGENVSPATVEALCRSRDLALSAGRWCTVSALQAAYRQKLAAADLIDGYELQRRALASPVLRNAEKSIILLGTVDLPRLTRELLARIPLPVIALIHAPETAGSFDQFGWLQAEAWQHADVPLRPEHFTIVHHPADQAAEIARVRAELADVGPDHISIALGDETLGQELERELELAGYPARFGPERRADNSGPFQLLELLASWWKTPKAETLAALLRHAEMDDWLRAQVPNSGVPIGGWPTVCDRFLIKYLPFTIHSGLDQLKAPLKLAVRELELLTQSFATATRPLSAWAGPLKDLLDAFFPRAHEQKQQAVSQALDGLHQQLDELSLVRSENPLSRSTDFAGAVGILLELAAQTDILAPEREGVIEMTGWLEAHFDDAPVLFVTGFNEGNIPKSQNAAPLLPDGLRSALGLPDNRRRYARDAYFLSAILASRPLVRLLCARFGPEGDRLAPSRLLFACDAATVASRVREFYEEASQTDPPAPLLPYGKINRLTVLPQPFPPDPPLESLRVTAFRDYLANPYRFFLKEVLRLESLEDGQLELAPDIFGNILHQVLNQYGTWRIQNFSGSLGLDAAPVEVFLLAELEAAVEKHLSRPTFPAIGFQIQRLRRRLSAFAAFEAARATEGWRIHQVESSAEISLPFDGFNFKIEGRMDRIDCSADGSTYRIIDYKSGDSGKKPDEIHRAKQGDSRVWIDLQLPLYRRLAPGLDIPESAVEVGYLVLPKDLGKVKWLPAEWTEDEFQEAYTTADTIIHAVHAGKFWPAAETLPAFNDGLSALCRDTIIGRAEFLADTSGPPLKWTFRPRRSSREVTISD